MFISLLFACLILFSHLDEVAIRHVVHLESLEYPEIARIAQIEGNIHVQVKIGPDGRVTSAVGQSGNPILKKCAEENARKWVFEPGADSTLEITYKFLLDYPQVYYRPSPKIVYDLPDKVLIVSNYVKPST
jgi:TonB family protein